MLGRSTRTLDGALKLHRLICAHAVLLSAMPALADTVEPPDDMCDELERFAHSVSDREPHTVRLTTDWSFPDFTRACKHNSQEPEKELCAWLVENTSTEFMTNNIGRVLDCMGLRKEQTPLGYRPFIRSLAGEVFDPNFTAKDVELKVTFDSGSEEDLPWLEITVTDYRE